MFDQFAADKQFFPVEIPHSARAVAFVPDGAQNAIATGPFSYPGYVFQPLSVAEVSRPAAGDLAVGQSHEILSFNPSEPVGPDGQVDVAARFGNRSPGPAGIREMCSEFLIEELQTRYLFVCGTAASFGKTWGQVLVIMRELELNANAYKRRYLPRDGKSAVIAVFFAIASSVIRVCRQPRLSVPAVPPKRRRKRILSRVFAARRLRPRNKAARRG